MTTTTESLVNAVFDRLSDDNAPDELLDAVLAAAGGEEAFDAWTGGDAPTRPTKTTGQADAAKAGVFLTGLEVEGFRGIGPPARLDFAPGPGLHVVIGRNGCGKTSFAEALEVLLTGESRRLKKSSDAWSDWQNLHHTGACAVTATTVVEGTTTTTTLRRKWAPGEAIRTGATEVQTTGQPKTDLAAIGWKTAVELYQPMLCGIDFDDLTDSPSLLHDVLVKVLDLAPYSEAKARLDALEKEQRTLVDAPKKASSGLISRLKQSSDPRAADCLAAIDTGRKPWDLDALNALVVGDHDADGELAVLHEVLALRLPTIEDVGARTASLRDAALAMEDALSDGVELAARVTTLLDQALALHDHEGDLTCPVCGETTLDATWRSEAEARRRDLATRTTALDVARTALRAELTGARALVVPLPRVLADGIDGLDVAPLRDAWQVWSATPEGGVTARAARELADHLGRAVLDLVDTGATVQSAAQVRLAQLDAEWRPLATDLAAWITSARRSIDAAAKQKIAKDAANWYKLEIERLRAARFGPLQTEAQNVWKKLRYRSNVDLVGVSLGGSSTRRRVDFALTVDGTEAGPGVLSQGEINALALSVFIPRVTRVESPFRFLVIDDPVQSMDPAKVDGLAHVLADLAKTRQVIVLTHDDRLPQSIRRLGLPARVVELVRGERSVVQSRPVLSPAGAALESAKAVGADTTISVALQDRIIPGFCRMALEAIFTDLAWRKLLADGRTHREIDDLLDRATKLTPRASLALFGNLDDGAKVLPRLNQIGRWAGDAYQDCNKGAHQAVPQAWKLIPEVERLIKALT